MINCVICKKKFRDQYTLNRHHSRKFPCKEMIKCERCNKDFRDQYNLTSHQSKKNKCKNVGNEVILVPEKINNVKKCYSCQFCFTPFLI